jgi:hypothetical protein
MSQSPPEGLLDYQSPDLPATVFRLESSRKLGVRARIARTTVGSVMKASTRFVEAMRRGAASAHRPATWLDEIPRASRA